MTSEKRIEVLKAREYKVVKHNDLALKTRYDFTINEQKTLAYICSMIKPVDQAEMDKPFQLEYEFNILDYTRVCGIQDNGRVYEETKALLKGLRDKSMWLKLDNGSETTVGWLDKVTTNKRSGKATIKIDNDLVPYLFNLQQKYLSYGLKNILCMKSQYSIRMYELIKAYYDMRVGQLDKRNKANQGKKPMSITWILDLDELKKMLGTENIESYKNYKNFRIKVLEISEREINETTDLNIYFRPILKGRKTVKIEFSITGKTTINRCMAERKNDEILGIYFEQ